MIESTFVWSHDRTAMIDVAGRLIDIYEGVDNHCVQCSNVVLYVGTFESCKAYLVLLGARLLAFKGPAIKQSKPPLA